MQDLNFILSTVTEMCSGVESAETVSKIIGSANQYAQVRKYPQDKTQWSDQQLDAYFGMIEKLVDMPTVFTQEDFDSMSIQEKLSAVGIETEDITPGVQAAGDMLGGIVDKMEKQNSYRDDLKCPYCKSMVYDNRNNKKSDKSPDFVCSTNNPVVCGGHTGKWRKSWWLDNTDIPKEWGIHDEAPF